MQLTVFARSMLAAMFGLSSAAMVSAQTIKIDGSSTVYPITEAVAEEFQAVNKNVKVTVGISGTGGGMKKFVRGELDICDASRPIKKDEVETCKAAGIEFIEIPVAFDALTVVIHAQNDWAASLTTDQLKKIWHPDAANKIKSWKDVDSKFPDVPLKLFGPDTDSGTFEYFTEAINHKAKAIRPDYTPSADDQVLVQGVAGDRGALGYFGYAYFIGNKDKLKAVAVDNGSGKAILPSGESVEDGTYAPLSRPIFIYVKKSSLARPEIRQFVEFYLKKGPDLVEKVKYIPLPTKAYKIGLDHVAKGKTGTVFGSGVKTIGVRIEQLMEMESK